VLVYLDNAATAHPKAPGVAEAMARSLGECNANPGHAGHRLALRAATEVYRARAVVAELLGVADPRRIVFTGGATAGLNQALWGSLPPTGGHVVCTAWEHNAVLRPLRAWARRSGGRIQVVPPRDPELSLVDPADVAAAIRADTVLIVLNAASNVTGVLAPVAEVGELARRRGVRLVVDGAQLTGHLPLALDALPVDVWVCPGHKGLLGPQGVGVLYVAPGVELAPLILGGTGVRSEDEDPPTEAPERYEAGTLNTPGILGLGAAAAYLAALGLGRVREREQVLHHALAEGLRVIPGVEVFTAGRPERGVGVVSCRLPGWRPAVAAAELDRRFGVLTRAGLHCAPLAHQALGTVPDGTVRLSLGPFSTVDEVSAALEAIRWLVAHPEAAAGGGEGVA
jgi:cysteine desulfurase/selenocysteine lyase